MRRIRRSGTVFLVLCGLAGLTPALGTESVVWQIGKFDRCAAEFNDRVDFTDPNYNPTFVLGKSNPAIDWPARQPGSGNKEMGGRPHPFTIIFDLATPPNGIYRLIISTLIYSVRVPHLLVEINGKPGLYYLNRKLSYYPGDMWVFSPTYGEDQLEIGLPAEYLLTGENKLVVTALDDPEEGPGDSLLSYDALRLTNNPTANPASSPQVTVQPTVFYTQTGDRLQEQIWVIVTPNQQVHRGNVTLAVGKDKVRANLSDARNFGEQRFEFSIPELTGKVKAEVSVDLNDRTRKFPVTLEPKRKWTIYLVPHQHLDVGFTDYQGKVAEAHNRTVDKLVDSIAQNPEARFSLDGSWIVRNYFATRDQVARQTFLRFARDRAIGVPAQFANLLTGYASLEVLIRSLFYSLQMHREYDIPFDYANITDVPSYSWSYASILGSLGLKYFAAGSNNARATIMLGNHWNEKPPFYWQGPDGNKILMVYTRMYAQLSFVCGLPPQVPAAHQALPTFLDAFESHDYVPDVVLMYGSQGENTALVPGIPEFVKNWNSLYAYPKLVLATFPDYFRYIEQRFGSSLETVVGDGGPFWEDSLGTDAFYCAMDRSNQQRATSAEKLSTIGFYLHKYAASPFDQIRRMWEDLILYAEHTFTSAGGYSRPESQESIRQLNTKDQFAVDGRERVNAILDQSLSQLADRIHIPATALVVFNPLSWARSGLVETDLEAHKAIIEYPSMTPVPFEVLHHFGANGAPSDAAGRAPDPDYSHVRFLARDVPSLGYRCYQIVSERGHGPVAYGETPLPLSNTIENAFYRVEVDPAAGAVRSLFDKQLARELVASTSPYRLNQYLYVAGGDETATQIVFVNKALPLAKLAVSTSATGSVTSNRRTSYGQILTYRTSGPHAPFIEADIILFDHEKKVEFIDRFRKEPVNSLEAVYFAFPFGVDKPRFEYEIQNGWVDPSRDLLKGANREWFTVQHWIKVAGHDYAVGLVPVDAPVVTLGDINRGTWAEEFRPKSATIFSYVMNNYWYTNCRRIQSGDYTFRYVLTSGPELAPETLAREGRDAMTPLEVGQLINIFDKFENPDAPLTPAPTSFLELSDSNVIVENWKGAEDGQGTMLRLLEVGGRSVTVRLRFPLFKLKEVWLTNAAEENRAQFTVANDSVDVPLKPHEIVTLRIDASKIDR